MMFFLTKKSIHFPSNFLTSRSHPPAANRQSLETAPTCTGGDDAGESITNETMAAGRFNGSLGWPERLGDSYQNLVPKAPCWTNKVALNRHMQLMVFWCFLAILHVFVSLRFVDGFPTDSPVKVDWLEPDTTAKWDPKTQLSGAHSTLFRVK